MPRAASLELLYRENLDDQGSGPHLTRQILSYDFLDWFFQLELLLATSTEFQYFSDRLRFAATLFRDGALMWWRTVYDSVELTSWEDFYALMITQF